MLGLPARNAGPKGPLAELATRATLADSGPARAEERRYTDALVHMKKSAIAAAVVAAIAAAFAGANGAAAAGSTRTIVLHPGMSKRVGRHRIFCTTRKIARTKSRIVLHPGHQVKIRGVVVRCVRKSKQQPPTTNGAHVSVGQAVIRPGASLLTTGQGFKPGSSVHLILHSDPISLGTAAVGSDGAFSQTVVIPASVPSGSHHVIAEGTSETGEDVAPDVALSIDATPPQVDVVTVSPQIASPGDTLTIAAHVTDDSGVQAIELQSRLTGSAGNTPFCDNYATLTTGTSTDGTWSITCTVTDHTLNGNYVVTPYAEDVAGNWLNSNGGPTTDTTGTFTITGGLDPPPPPDIVSISATPATLSPGDSFVVSAHVTSEIGVQAIELQSLLDGSSGVWPFCDSYATLTSGTALDGVWSIDCTVPDQVLSGGYTITPYAEDIAGDWTNTNGGPASPTTGTFTVTGGLSNVDRPTVVSIDVDPNVVSTGQTFTVSAHVTSPVGVKAIELQSSAVGVPGNWAFCDGYATLASGTTTDGIWSLQCTVPAIVASGSYVVTPYVEDILGQWVNSNGGPPSDTQGSFTVS